MCVFSFSLSLSFLFILSKTYFLFPHIVVSFRLYDADDSGTIDKDELFQVLKAVLFDTYLIELSDEDLMKLVDDTFAEADRNGDDRIDLEEYRQLVVKYPNIIKNFTIDRSVLRR